MNSETEYHLDKDAVADVPSHAWGWSGESPKFFRAMGWVIVLALLVQLIGNHVGRVEDWWLVGIAASMAGMLLFDSYRRRTRR